MNYLLILFILPLIGLFIWIEYLTSQYERKIKNLKRLVYQINDKVNKLEEDSQD